MSEQLLAAHVLQLMGIELSCQAGYFRPSQSMQPFMDQINTHAEEQAGSTRLSCPTSRRDRIAVETPAK